MLLSKKLWTHADLMVFTSCVRAMVTSSISSKLFMVTQYQCSSNIFSMYSTLESTYEICIQFLCIQPVHGELPPVSTESAMGGSNELRRNLMQSA